MSLTQSAVMRGMLNFGLAWLLAPTWAEAAPPRPMLELHDKGEVIQGTPLATFSNVVEVLGRDGRLLNIQPDAMRNAKKLPMSFRSYAPAEMRAALQHELHGRLEVHNTSHFIVACPHGQERHWIERLEKLLRSFQHYFSVRGLTPQEPQFPLIVLVWPSQAEFQTYASEERQRISSQVLGYYSPGTNRVALFDSLAGAGGDWSQNEYVIIHEITHQYAFNCGIHNRFQQTPRWLCEGLAMLFEAPGLWDPYRYAEFKDRVNRMRLQQFRSNLAHGRTPQAWLRLVGSDANFERNMGAAYAESWAFSFFLVETMPAKYCAYLKRTSAGPNFANISEAKRIADFKAVFGDDFRALEANFLRFIAAIK